MSTQVLRSKTSDVVNTSPGRSVLQRTVNCWKVPIVVPLPLGQRDDLCLLCIVVPDNGREPAGIIVVTKVLETEA
jgi:hypothetical protein